jgi:hypothetical protein
VWEYRIGAYQVMAKYLEDRKEREAEVITGGNRALHEGGEGD